MHAFFLVHALEHALFHNPALQAILPVLLQHELIRICNELKVEEERDRSFITKQLWNQSSVLLWISFRTGNDVFSDKLVNSSRNVLLLQRLLKEYQLPNSTRLSHPCLFSIDWLNDFLEGSGDATQLIMILHIFIHSISQSESLFNALAQPRQAILKQSVIQSICETIYQFIIAVHTNGIDKSIRQHVILHNESIPAHLPAISGESERQLTKAKALLELAPFSVFGTQLDVWIQWKRMMSRFNP